jgi:hypothetical protein
MRIPVIAALVIAGCTHQEGQTTSYQKAPSSRPGKPSSQVSKVPAPESPVTFACRPEPAGGCNNIHEVNACRSELRCQWVREHEKATGTNVAGYCRKIHCRES